MFVYLFLVTFAVVNIEIIKFVICHLVVWFNDGWSVGKFCKTIYENIMWKEIVLISVPAFVYTIQNNLLFVALEYLDPTTFQLCYQVSEGVSE
jgi:solute carrier family 35 (UDP-sugar transporter), member A1/2/3